MTRKKLEQLNLALFALQYPLKIVERCGQRHIEFLLKMAILDLKTKVHKISDRELRTFCEKVAAEQDGCKLAESTVIDARVHFARANRS